MKFLRILTILLGITIALSKLATASDAQAIEHAVIVHFHYGSTNLQPLFALEEKLEAAIAQADAGEYDGNEVAIDGSDGRLYMYGPDADRLFQTVKPLLEATPFMAGAKVRKRYGPPQAGVKESDLVINP